jgi:hypothetical protein
LLAYFVTVVTYGRKIVYNVALRSRADEARRREAELEKNATPKSDASNVTPSYVTSSRVAMSPVISARTFNTRRNRAATIERDMEVTVTVTEKPATEVEPATSWRSRIYGETNREAASYYPVRRRRPQSPETLATTPPTATTTESHNSSITRPSRFDV